MFRIVRLFVLACAVLWQISAAAVHAQGLPLIRDSEIEAILRAWCEPLFAAARLDPSAVRIFVVNDPGLNAFVAGGQNVFLNTGLLTATETPGQAMGVVAHEAGHIAGGHLARTGDAARAAAATGLFATLLGAGLVALGAASGASNAGQAGAAIIVGGQSAGMRAFLAYTRAQERSADRAALDILDRAGKSARGLLDFLRKLEGQELLVSDRQDPYVRSHPLTAERIAFIADHVARSDRPEEDAAPLDIERHARMRAKLIGFLERPRRVLRTYFPERDVSLAARYARAVAYMRLPDLPKALAEIDSLIAERPADPFFAELKGQILFEHGDARGALPSYERAAALAPGDALILTGLGRAQAGTGDPALLPAAAENLEAALRGDRDNALAWRTLAAARHGLGDAGGSALAAGEHALLVGSAENAARHAERAGRYYAEGSRGWLQAQDIENEAARIERMRRRAGG